MNILLKKICVGMIKLCSYCILCIPLVVVPSTLYPYVFPKVIFFQVLVEIVFLAWIPLLFLHKGYRLRFKHPIIVSLSVFIISLVITALMGADPYRSFFSTQERMTGVFFFLHLYVWFLMLISIFRTQKEWKKAIVCTTGAAFIIALYGYINQDAATRSISTVGNAIFFGSYILLHIFLLLFLFHKEKHKKRYFVFIFFIISLFISLLFFSGSRMIILSFLIGLFLLLVSYFYLYFSKIRKGIYLIFLFFVVTAAGCVFFFNLSSVGNAWAKKQLPHPVQRVLLVENYKKLQGARLEAWRIGLDGFKEKPLFGWGLENYPYIFQKYYRAPIIDEGEQYADRSHNQYIDILALTGIFGLISYLVFFAILFTFLIRTAVKEEEISIRLASMSLIVLFLVYLLQGITSFDSPSLLIVLYFSFALTYFFVSEQSGKEKIDDSKNKAWRLPLVVGLFQVILVACAIFIMQKWSIVPFIKNIQTRTALNAVKERGLSEATLSYFKDSLDSDSFTNYEARIIFAKSMGNVYAEKRAPSKDFARQAVEDAIVELDKSIQSRPLDAKNYFSQLSLYRIMAPYDQDLLKKIEQRIQEVYILAPYRPEIYREFPEIYIIAKDFIKAEEWVRKGVDHFMPPQVTHWQLAVVFLQKGDIESGMHELASAEKTGYPVFENPNMGILLSQKLPSGKKNSLALQYIDHIAQIYPNNKDVISAQSEAHKKAE